MPVAFDAVTSAIEVSGDGVLSLSHTASGSDRAAFAGSEAMEPSFATTTTTSVTYGGSSMTEAWDLVFGADAAHSAGYSIVAPATTAQTVTATLSIINPVTHVLGVISLTGVHQTTPVGTAATSTGTATSGSVTVGSVGADDLVVDALITNDAETVGADQTGRWDRINGFVEGVGSTQPGTAGGVMSWSWGSSKNFALGAMAFKPAAGAASVVTPRSFALLGVGA